MKPPPFTYVRASTVEECLETMAEHGDEAKILAGGQSLVPLMNLRLARPGWVVDINRVSGLDHITIEGETLRIGAMARHRDVARSDAVARACPLLAQAAAMIGHPAIRNRGTIGGSLAHADPAAELPCVVCATDAEIVAAGREGRRAIPAGEFFAGYFETALYPSELLIEVRIPIAAPGEAWQFREFTRKSGDFAVAAAAVGLTAADGRVSRARIALGGMADRPLRATEAEELLADQPLEAADLAGAAALVAELGGSELRDRSDAGQLASVLVRRALDGAIAELKEAN